MARAGEVARRPDGEEVGHDLVGTIVALREQGVTLRASWAIRRARRTSRSRATGRRTISRRVAKHVLGRSLPDDDELLGVGRQRKTWARCRSSAPAQVAGQRADASRRHLEGAVAAHRRRSSPSTSRCETLRAHGARGLDVDRAELDGARGGVRRDRGRAAGADRSARGHAFNINSSQQLGTVLFEELKLPIVSHTKTGWSTSTEALERIEHAHPIVPLVLRWRTLRRLRDNWMIALPECIDADGRVHSRFHPARSFSGQLDQHDPDLGARAGPHAGDGA